MKAQNIFLAITLTVTLHMATQITAVGQDNSSSKHSIGTSVGYARIDDKNGMGMDIRYSYSLMSHLNVMAGVGMDNAYTQYKQITTNREIPMIQTGRVALGIEAETNVMDRLSIGATAAAIAQAEFYTHCYLPTTVRGVLLFYAEFDVNIMYWITNTIAAGCYANAKLNDLENKPLIGIGAKMSFSIR